MPNSKEWKHFQVCLVLPSNLKFCCENAKPKTFFDEIGVDMCTLRNCKPEEMCASVSVLN